MLHINNRRLSYNSHVVEWTLLYRGQTAIEEVLKDNAFMQELQSRIVPLIVDQDTFWTRYFYR